MAKFSRLHPLGADRQTGREIFLLTTTLMSVYNSNLMQPPDEFRYYMVYFLPMVMATLVSIGIAYYTWRRKEMRGSIAFTLFMLDIALWSANTGFLELSRTTEMALIWYKLRYLSIATAPTLLFIFTFQYSGRFPRLSVPVLAGLFAIPAITQVIIWGKFDLFVQQVQFELNNSLMLIVRDTNGPWFTVHFTYAFVSILAGILLQVITGIQSGLIFRWQALALVLGGLPTFLLSAILATFLDKSVAMFTPLGFLFMGLVYAWILFRMRLFDLNSISRSFLFDNMGEGVLLTDHAGRIVDINHAGAMLFNQPAKQLMNQNIQSLLPLPEPTSTAGHPTLEIYTVNGDRERWLAVKISPVKTETFKGVGNLLLVEDITDQKFFQQALRQVYEITAVANEYQQLDQMLTRILAITLKAARSPTGFIHLLNEDDQHLELTACIGLPPASVTPDAFGEIWQEVANLDRLTISDEIHTTVEGGQMGGHFMVGLPIKKKGRMSGTLCLALKNPPILSNETNDLLAAIADQIGIAVESARLLAQAEKSAVTLERQRLARELHDSVTQSLFGAVLLAQAGINSFSRANYPEAQHSLARVQEISRQALKEMRLLIYELRPLDLQDIGLQEAIRQRLATVENRVDIHTSLVYVSEVEISGETALGLYRIVQEALNNVLKHAHATQVAVNLQADQVNIRLQVEDNGIGFDVGQVEKAGGLGIAGMRERTDGLHGQLTLQSQPGAGTRLLVECPTPQGTALLDTVEPVQ